MITNVSAPCILVAMPSMIDSGFSKSVILLAEHSEDGAVGFVLNRPSTVPLKSMISVIDREIPAAIPAWYGGPVDTGTAIILHSRKPIDGDTEISHDIFLSTSGRILDSLIDESEAAIRDRSMEFSKSQTLNPYRFLVGYAGWSAGQLDDEIKAGAWLIHPIDRDIIFNVPWSEMWNILVARLGMARQTSANIAPPTQATYLN